MVDAPGARLAAWELDATGLHTGEIVLADQRSELEYTVLASVAIGGRAYEWAEVGSVAPGRVTIPEEAEMVVLQETAVSQLLVIVEARRLTDGALMWREALPLVGLVWSAGLEAAPRWMSWAEVEREAPVGILGRAAVVDDDERTVPTGGVPANLVDAAQEVVR